MDSQITTLSSKSIPLLESNYYVYDFYFQFKTSPKFHINYFIFDTNMFQEE